MKIRVKSFLRLAIKRPCLFKNHVFSMSNLGKRDQNGRVEWECVVCNSSFNFDYGLQALGVGRIVK